MSDRVYYRIHPQSGTLTRMTFEPTSAIAIPDGASFVTETALEKLKAAVLMNPEATNEELAQMLAVNEGMTYSNEVVL